MCPGERFFICPHDRHGMGGFPEVSHGVRTGHLRGPLSTNQVCHRAVGWVVGTVLGAVRVERFAVPRAPDLAQVAELWPEPERCPGGRDPGVDLLTGKLRRNDARVGFGGSRLRWSSHLDSPKRCGRGPVKNPDQTDERAADPARSDITLPGSRGLLSTGGPQRWKTAVNPRLGNEPNG